VSQQAVWEPLPDDIHFAPSPNYGYPGKVPYWRAVTWHITQGSLEGSLARLRDPDSQASAHIVIARDGAIYSLVPLKEPAWAQGIVREPDLRNPIVQQTVSAGVNPNLRSYSIECVGFTTYERGGSLTAPQALALQRVTAYLCWRAHMTCDRTHILGHYQWDSVSRWNDPGFAPWEWALWIARAAELCRLWRGW